MVQKRATRRPTNRGRSADSFFEDTVQYSDGFRTQLIGTPEQIAEDVGAYRKRGVDLILGGFLHLQEKIEYFGANVLPLVREIEDTEANSRDAVALVSLNRSAHEHWSRRSEPRLRLTDPPGWCASVGG
jgi:dimethylsulfone monooxygenase